MRAHRLLTVMGPGWVLYRLGYAARQRCGLFARRWPVVDWEDLPEAAFTAATFPGGPLTGGEHVVASAEDVLAGRFLLFSCHPHQDTFPPNWFRSPWSQDEWPHDRRHWSQVSDFGSDDIKGVWELSRFTWVYPLMRAYASTQDERYADAFWRALEDWRQHNPPQAGVHWRCGQEATFRMIAWLSARTAFASSAASTPERDRMLAQMVAETGRRIAANIGYAISQCNNHGISEAVGLLAAGIAVGRRDWRDRGQAVLEQQINTLIYDDGSFSQHSSNYHRLMLQTCLWAVQVARTNGISLGDPVIARLRSAAQWLKHMVDPESGLAPNLGANDGALLFPLTDCDYTDFRPTLQAASVMLTGERLLPDGAWDALAEWLCGPVLTQAPAAAPPPTGSVLMADGGYACILSGKSRAVLRCPVRFRHRPSQCDLLHVDVWSNGVNLLPDAGSFSYNCEPELQRYFPGPGAHNTIQFDDHDQMPKLGRFLYDRWPVLERHADLSGDTPFAEAGYSDWCGCHHKRRLERTAQGFRITDTGGGFVSRAVLRWRLNAKWPWTLDADGCHCDVCFISVHVTGGSADIKLASGRESRYYLDRDVLQVLETALLPGVTHVTTEIRFVI